MTDKGRKTADLDEAVVNDEGFGSFEGYANVTGIVDDGGDRVMRGAFQKTIPDFLKEGFISLNHDWGTPVAIPTSAEEDENGLYIKADFHSTAIAQDARKIAQERIAKGKSIGLSIGYEIAAADMKQGIREISSFKRLFEVGLVLVPMNRPSVVTSIKGSLGSETPYSERLSLALAEADKLAEEMKSLAEHSRNRAELRQKEGRVLSTDNRTRLATLKESLNAVLVDIADLLDATDPDRDEAAKAAIIRSIRTLSGV